MTQTMLEAPVTNGTCPECREPVLTRYTTGQHRVMLDPERVLGGLYELDEHDRADRRRSFVCGMELAGKANQGGGFAVHECNPAALDHRYLA